ncbi:hypothetical protein MHK_004044 [Candidatus Magnetomorum sp. HK-1]|nr:hypothetical protein MHK_004044 [Candidatus Magnetomorum sp. HK-1]
MVKSWLHVINPLLFLYIIVYLTCGFGLSVADVNLTHELFLNQLKKKHPNHFKYDEYPKIYYFTNVNTNTDDYFVIDQTFSIETPNLYNNSNRLDLDRDGQEEFIFVHKFEGYKGAISIFHQKKNTYYLQDFFPLAPALRDLIIQKIDIIHIKKNFPTIQLYVRNEYIDQDIIYGNLGLESEEILYLIEFKNNKLIPIFSYPLQQNSQVHFQSSESLYFPDIVINNNQHYQFDINSSSYKPLLLIDLETYKHELYINHKKACDIYRNEKNIIKAIAQLKPFFQQYDYSLYKSKISDNQFTQILNDYAFFLIVSLKENFYISTSDQNSIVHCQSKESARTMLEKTIFILNDVIKREPERNVAYLNLADAQYILYHLCVGTPGLETLKEWYMKNYQKYFNMMKNANKTNLIPERVYNRK